MNKQDKLAYNEVIKRDSNRCVICGNNSIEIHHIVYRSLGGITDKRNMVCLCKQHHMEYHAMGKEGIEILLDIMRLHYGCIEQNDLKKKGKYANFAFPN